MLVSELMRQIGSGDLPPVLLFAPGKAPFGREPFEPQLAEEAIAKITDSIVEPEMRDMGYASYYAEESKPGEVAMEANTLPFLVERRVILVRNADRYFTMSSDKKSDLAPLLEYMNNPNPATVLLLLAPKADKRKKFYKACGEAGAVVECPQLDDNELARWIEHAAEVKGKHIQRRAAQELMSRSGARLSDVENAVNLVINYVGDVKEITEDDVILACADVAEETVWTLTDAISESDTSKALATLYQLLDLGKSADEILGIINWLLESAYRAAPQSQVKLQSKFVERKVMPLVNKVGFAKLKDALALCTNTHLMIRSTGVDQMLALELLVIKLSAPRGRRRAA